VKSRSAAAAKAAGGAKSAGRIPKAGPGGAPYRALLVIAAIAFLVRLVYLSGLSVDPLTRSLELDPKLNDERAWSIAQGEPSEPTPYFRAPLYTETLALVYRGFSHSLNVARVAQSLLGVSTVFLLGLIAWDLWGRRAALLAAVFAGFYGPLIFFEGQLVSATLETTLAALAVWLMLRLGRIGAAGKRDPTAKGDSAAKGGRAGKRRAHLWGAALAGLVLSAAAITRPTFLPFAIVACVWLLRRGAGERVAAVYLAAVFLLPGMVTARNAIVGKDPVFIASQGGINFFIGNNAEADGTTPNVPGAGSGIAGTEEAPARIASAAVGHPLRASEVSAYWFGRGLEFWVKEPLRAIALFGRKIALVWNRRELPNLLDLQFFAPFHSWLFRGPWLFSFAVLAPLALVAAWFERRHALLLVGYLGVHTLVTAAFFVCDRFRLPLVVGVIPLAAFATDRVFVERERLRSIPGLITAHRGTALLLVGAAALVWLPFFKFQKTETGMSWYRLARAYERSGDSRHAAEAYLSAERAGLDTPEFFNDEGLIHLHHQDVFGAESYFRRAVERKPNYGPAHANLAEVHFERGNYGFAAQEYEIAAGLIPERAAELYVNAGTVYADIGNRDHARTMFEAALRAHPGMEEAEEGLAGLDKPAAAERSP
jgi:tetratricopeptide (TPR) repeat protein